MAHVLRNNNTDFLLRKILFSDNQRGLEKVLKFAKRICPMKETFALLVIDAQYDFCAPQGSLYVPGADKDIERLVQFIDKNLSSIDGIILSLDAHPYFHISHPCYWISSDGKNPEPFTIITDEDLYSLKWRPVAEENYSVAYIKQLKLQGQFQHVIWPYHCVAGTKGSTIVDNLMDSVRKWSLHRNRSHQSVFKGTNPFTEQYGIFSASIPDERYEETQPNRKLLASLDSYDYVFVAGEARSHCVATSIQQIMDLKPELTKKLLILQDCMTDVPGFEGQGRLILEKAVQMGAKMIDSNNTI